MFVFGVGDNKLRLIAAIHFNLQKTIDLSIVIQSDDINKLLHINNHQMDE